MSPNSRKDELRSQFVGKTLHDVPTPSVVLDLAQIDVNCQSMLETVERLSLSWRPHIKTHKAGPGKLPENVWLDIDLLSCIVDDRAYATTSWRQRSGAGQPRRVYCCRGGECDASAQRVPG